MPPSTSSTSSTIDRLRADGSKEAAQAPLLKWSERIVAAKQQEEDDDDKFFTVVDKVKESAYVPTCGPWGNTPWLALKKDSPPPPSTEHSEKEWSKYWKIRERMRIESTNGRQVVIAGQFQQAFASMSAEQVAFKAKRWGPSGSK